MLLLGRHLLVLPSVLDVDVDPPIGELSGELFGPPERLSAVGEHGGPPVLMFHGPLLARVLIGVYVVAVGVFHISSPASRQAVCRSRWVLGMDTIRTAPLYTTRPVRRET